MSWRKDFGAKTRFFGRRGAASPWLITIFGEHVDLRNLPFTLLWQKKKCFMKFYSNAGR
jgi:hypothetical protein